MKSLNFLIVTLILIFPALALSAQESTPEATAEPTPEGWPIIERCFPEPITPPDDWTFNGDILMHGWGGIHAVNAELDTPFVVSWGGGRLSPDGSWVLTQDFRSYTQNLTGFGPLGLHHRYYGDITVTRLSDGEAHIFEWESYVSFTSGPYPFPPAGPIWLDNERFLAFYGWEGREYKVGDIETGEITEWTGIGLEDYESSMSPDSTRIISYGRLYDLSDNSLITEDMVIRTYDLQSSVWTNDSSMFADNTSDRGNYTEDLSIFDRNGNLLVTPFYSQENLAVWASPGKWSPDSNYLSVFINRYHILDMGERVIYDLYVEISGLAWSPDGTAFATILGTEGQRPLVVVDFETWQVYIVGYHNGSVFFWRGAE